MELVGTGCQELGEVSIIVRFYERKKGAELLHNGMPASFSLQSDLFIAGVRAFIATFSTFSLHISPHLSTSPLPTFALFTFSP